MWKRSAALPALLCLALLTGCGGPAPAPAEAELFAMDTVMGLTAYGENGQAAVEEASAQIRRLEGLLSRTDAGSQVSAVNAGAGTFVPVGEAVYDLVSFSMGYCFSTDFCFDITVAPVVSAWGFTEDTQQVPSRETLSALLPLVDSSLIEKDPGSQPSPTVIVPPSVKLAAGQSMDLGGIAKGYASDCVEEIFRGNGVASGKITLGGNVFVLGTKPDGSDWRVAVQDPNDPEAYVGVLSLSDAYAITSGGYQRYFEQDGKRYHHIIDPAAGCPADSGLVSVTVVAAANGELPNPDREDPFPGHGAMCDAFSTALFVMGEERALDFWRAGEYEFELVLVTEDGRVLVTEGLAGRFEGDEESDYAYESIAR